MSKRADDLAASAAAEFSEFTPEKRAEYGPVILGVSRLAAKKIKDSQIAWHTFRDQYCNAIALSYTSGSGADTAMEMPLHDSLRPSATASDRFPRFHRAKRESAKSVGFVHRINPVIARYLRLDRLHSCH